MRQSEPGEYEALEEAAASSLEKLYTRPELRDLIEEIKRDLDPAEAAMLDNEARRSKLEAAVVRVPAQRVAVATAKVVLKRSGRPLEQVADEAGIALDDFKQLHAGSPTARTQIALRVLDQIDAIYHKADKTLGGTARLPRPRGIRSRNITGTERFDVPDEVQARRAEQERLAGQDARPERHAGPERLAASRLPNPIWLAAVVAIFVAVVLLAVFR